jgi:hypothetical protein
VVDGEVIPVCSISGVLVRLAAVTEPELPMIVAEDRTYAAREMTAFLVYWLSSLPCPVLNRPAASGLCGPGWRSERWVLTAARLGLPVSPRRHQTPAFGSEPASAVAAGIPSGPGDSLVTATLIGDRCVGVEDEVVADRARMLASAAGVGLLSARFRGHGAESVFLDAYPWVDLNDPQTAGAIGDYFAMAQPSSA